VNVHVAEWPDPTTELLGFHVVFSKASFKFRTAFQVVVGGRGLKGVNDWLRGGHVANHKQQVAYT
jgi:hypothetical protein